MRTISNGAVLLLLAVYGGCAAQPERHAMITIVLLDISCSPNPAALRAYESTVARSSPGTLPTEIQAYDRAWREIVRQAQPGDRLVLGPITGEAVAFRPVVDEELALVNPLFDNGPDRDDRRHAFETKNIDAVANMFMQPCSNRTPLLDTLDAAAALLAVANKTRKRLVILSDGLEDAGGVKFDKVPPVKPRQLINARRRANALPDFRGAEVVFVGADAPNRATLRAVQEFWHEYFDATHGRIINYGAVLMAPITR